MNEREDFRKGIERLIDQMIARLPEEMQSAVRKQLASQREVAWRARAQAIKASKEKEHLEEAAKVAADCAEQELLKLLLTTLTQEQHWRLPDPENVRKYVELVLKINEKYTEWEVAKAKCPKNRSPVPVDIDDLTGVFNTRHLNKVLAEEIARAEDYQRPLTMLMLDIDGFKRVNNMFGHFAGDDVLKCIADILRSSVRPIDFVFRFGGDEFIVLLPDISLDPALHIGEDIRDMIGTSSLALVGKITVSVAGCQYQAGEGEQGFMARVNEAMFRAKRDRDERR